MPAPVAAITFQLEMPDIGWMPVTISAGDQTVAFSASTVFDPFPELVRWLEGMAAGRFPRLLINTEGVNVAFHIFQSEGDTVRFVVTNDAEADDAIDLDVCINRTTLVHDIYKPLLIFWESESLARTWRKEWRYDDDADDDPLSDTNRPYPVRSLVVEAFLASAPR
jgi:hypothetical protein